MIPVYICRTDTAAIVVGGIRDLVIDGGLGSGTGSAEVLKTAEIFGCPQSRDRSV